MIQLISMCVLPGFTITSGIKESLILKPLPFKSVGRMVSLRPGLNFLLLSNKA